MEDIVRSISASKNESNHRLLEQSSGTFDLEDDKYTINAEWLNNKKFIKQLEKDNIDVGLLREELSRQNRRKHHYTWRERILEVIKGNFVQVFLSILILLDAGIVITEIILEIHSMKSKIEFQTEQKIVYRTFLMTHFNQFLNKSLLTQQHNSHNDDQDASIVVQTILDNVKNTSDSDLSSWCSSNFFSTPSSKLSISPPPHLRVRRAASSHSNSKEAHSSTTSTQQKAEILHYSGLYLHYISIAILIIFTIELILRIICTGPKFFHKKAEVFDGIIIITSLLADTIFVQLESEAISVMVIFLLWRIVRLINGLMMHEKQRDEFRITLQKKTRRICQMKVERLSTEKELLTKNVVALEDLVRESGGSEDQIRNCKPRFKSYSKEQTNNALKSIAALTTGFMGGLVGAPPASGQGQKLLSQFSVGTPTPNSPSPSGGANLFDGKSQSPSSSKKMRLRLRKISEAKHKDGSVEKGESSFENQSSSEAGDAAMSSPPTCSSAIPNDNKSGGPFRFLRAQRTSENEDLPLDEEECKMGVESIDECEIPCDERRVDVRVITMGGGGLSVRNCLSDKRQTGCGNNSSFGSRMESRGYASRSTTATSEEDEPVPEDDDVDEDYPPYHQIFAARASLPILTHAERRKNFREKFRRRNSSGANVVVPLECEDELGQDTHDGHSESHDKTETLGLLSPHQNTNHLESSFDSPPPSADEGIGSSSNSQMITSNSRSDRIFNHETNE